MKHILRHPLAVLLETVSFLLKTIHVLYFCSLRFAQCQFRFNYSFKCPKTHSVTTIFKRVFPCHLSGGGSLPRSEGATSTASWSSSTCPAACTGKGDCAHPTLLGAVICESCLGPCRGTTRAGGLSNKVRREATIFFSVERRTRTVIPHVWRKRGKQVWYKRPFSCLPIFFLGKLLLCHSPSSPMNVTDLLSDPPL